MVDASNEKLLVTGAGGHLGRAIIEDLLERGTRNVIAATRDPAKLAELAARGVEVREADFDRPETLSSAFAGVSRLMLVSTDAVHTPGQRRRQHRDAIKAAVDAGVRHLVYTSQPSPHPTPESSIPDDHFWTEAALSNSPLDWTVLRNNLYAEVILMISAGPAIKTGQLITGTGTAGRSYVTRQDCARTAAGALLSASGREIYDVTGPEAITQEELAAELSALTGRTITHIAVTPEEIEQGWLAAGLPPALARLGYHYDLDTSQGYHAIVTPAVERFSGRAPTSVRDFLRAQKGALENLA